VSVASKNTLRLPAAEIAADDNHPIAVNGDTSYGAGLHAVSASSASLLIEGQDALLFVSEECPGRASLDAECLLTLLTN